MIQIVDKRDCCGCTACANRCPHQCITMSPDEEGFLYPVVDKDHCVHCNLCDSVCPMLRPSAPSLPLKVYAARQQDPIIRQKSSSGGVFSALAESIIHEEGVVFGAKFDEQWRVVHSYTETIEGLAAFRGSKYVQSSIGDSYSYAERFLQNGRKVLFSGTPCQISGLKCYLCKDYENLFTVDVICHGVPSPLVWNEYVKTLLPVTAVSFRDKKIGWHKYGFSVKHHSHECYELRQQNLFLRGYLQELYQRPICHHCPFREFKSGSDVTLGDFWGIHSIFPEMDDDKGVNIVFVKSDIIHIVDNSHVVLIELNEKQIQDSFKYNPSLLSDESPNVRRMAFFKALAGKKVSLRKNIKDNTVFTFHQRIYTAFEKLLLFLRLYKALIKLKRQYFHLE